MTRLSVTPPVRLFRTVDLIRRIQALRSEGIPAWLSIDAGPNVFAITEKAHETAVSAALEELPAVERCLGSGPGPDAVSIDEHLF